MAIVFWLAAAVVGFAYAGYPLLMALLARWNPRPAMYCEQTPRIDALLVVHNAATLVEAKLRNLLELDYPPGHLRINLVCDGCDDATESIARALESPRLRVLAHIRRRGKSACIADTLPLLDAELVLFTDVRQRIDGEAPPPRDPATRPASQTTTQSGPVADPVATTPRGGDYTVIGGDILSRIAMRFGTDWQSLARDNGLLNPDLIHPGQTLHMPGGPAAPGPVAGPVVEPVSGNGASTDRNAFYLAQPDEWSCGPTSLTMALAAWGVRPADMDTRNEAVGLIGQDWGSGVPGNASLIAEGARNAGLQASFNPDGSADAVRAALDAGHTVVLNGGLPGGGGHFLYVAGVDGNGNFIIGDPARPDVTTMTAAELEAFSFANPGQHPNGFAEIWR